jgi:guanylate kinase
MLVLSSPSGAGKSTLARNLLERDGDITMSVSATTRTRRSGEKDGVDYHFVSAKKFIEMRDADELLEWAEVFGNHYGTPRVAVEKELDGGRDVLFDIDWQGTQQLHGKRAGDMVRVFVLPPSAHELEERLQRRAQDSAEVVAKRMAGAANEIVHYAEYDYVIVNRDVEESVAQLVAILVAERLRRERQIGLSDFVRGILGPLSGS